MFELWLHALDHLHVLYLKLCHKQRWMDTRLVTCIFRIATILMFLQNTRLQKEVRHQMSPTTVLPAKQSRIFTKRWRCRADLQYQYIQTATVQFFFLIKQPYVCYKIPPMLWQFHTTFFFLLSLVRQSIGLIYNPNLKQLDILKNNKESKQPIQCHFLIPSISYPAKETK